MRRVLPIRAVEDDHVDRLGVEVQQCTKLTSTNRSIGLIPLIYQCSLYLLPAIPSVAWACEGTLRACLSAVTKANAFVGTTVSFDPEGSSKSSFSFEVLLLTGLVVIARRPNPIPSRTRPLSSSAPMVLRLKAWESRSLPGLLRAMLHEQKAPSDPSKGAFCRLKHTKS